MIPHYFNHVGDDVTLFITYNSSQMESDSLGEYYDDTNRIIINIPHDIPPRRQLIDFNLIDDTTYFYIFPSESEYILHLLRHEICHHERYIARKWSAMNYFKCLRARIQEEKACHKAQHRFHVRYGTCIVTPNRPNRMYRTKDVYGNTYRYIKKKR